MVLDPSTVTLVNSLLGLMLAGLMSVFWLRNRRNEAALWWMLSAWSFAVSHAAFLLRIWHAFFAMTLIASGTATMALVFMLVGVQRFIGLRSGWKMMVGVVACHLLAIGCSVFLDAPTSMRMLINSLFWAGISSATLFSLIHAAPSTWKNWYGFPALVIASYGAFNLVRILVCMAVMGGLLSFDLKWLQSLSFSAMSLFSVALYMSLLISDLRERNRELQSALDEVQTLSGLLPICSSCKKIRDDAGYWTKLETFISKCSGAQFSHGLCPDCAMSLYPEVFLDKLPETVKHMCTAAKKPEAQSDNKRKQVSAVE